MTLYVSQSLLRGDRWMYILCMPSATWLFGCQLSIPLSWQRFHLLCLFHPLSSFSSLLIKPFDRPLETVTCSTCGVCAIEQPQIQSFHQVTFWKKAMRSAYLSCLIYGGDHCCHHLIRWQPSYSQTLFDNCVDIARRCSEHYYTQFYTLGTCLFLAIIVDWTNCGPYFVEE